MGDLKLGGRGREWMTALDLPTNVRAMVKPSSRTKPLHRETTTRATRATESPVSSEILSDRQALLDWYSRVKRDLPWRRDQDPYRIWISEIMLQQTTVTAVIPYYERFMKRFPSVRALASAKMEDVLEQWAGLGYYSRARNLHRAALTLAAQGFPKRHDELIELPGFGPYTARAVASLAFNEAVGVVDGNVIRVLSRRYGLKLQWWKPNGRDEIQRRADALAQSTKAADVNQALMELGATVCTPQSPTCLLCPWAGSCVAREQDQISNLPLKRPRRERQIWSWRPSIVIQRGRVLLIANSYAPFLKGHWIPPGEAKQLKQAPRTFTFKGVVTHHDIFVESQNRRSVKSDSLRDAKWIALSQLNKQVPSSLVRKAINSVSDPSLAKTSTRKRHKRISK